MKNQSIDNYTY